MFFNSKKVRFNEKILNVFQIKEIHFDLIDFDFERCQLIAKSISDDGILHFRDCKFTKPGYEAFSVELGNKHVIQFRKKIYCFFDHATIIYSNTHSYNSYNIHTKIIPKEIFDLH